MGGDAWYNVTIANDTQYFNEADYYLSRITSGVDFRAKNLESFDSLEKTSLDLYASVRSLYLQDRRKKIQNIDEITETLSDDDWEEVDSQQTVMKSLKFILIFFLSFLISNISFAKNPSDLINEIVDDASKVLSSDDPVESKIIKLNDI